MEAMEGTTESTTEAGVGWAESAKSARARLRTLFAEALQMPETEVEPAADFFMLGGHSASAGRIIGAIRKETGVRVGLVAFFEDPTVQGLADVVTAGALTIRAPLTRSDTAQQPSGAGD